MGDELEFEKVDLYAKLSWVLPAASWGANCVKGCIPLPPMPLVHALWAVGDLIALVAGAYFGLRVLAVGRRNLAASVWTTAMLGTVLSLGALLLAFGMFANFFLYGMDE